MKRIVLVVALCGFVTTPVLATLTVTPTGNGGTYNGYGMWQKGNGGEFTLLPGGFDPRALYAVSAKDQGVNGTFQTFCVEESEHIYPNPTIHDVVFNTNAVIGGTGYAWPTGDPLSQGAAWLYLQFAKGTLSPYDYADTGTGRHESAAALQNAIWYLEQEPSTGLGAYQTMLETQFTSVANAMLDNATNGKYPVAVLNLYEHGFVGLQAHVRQDVLVLVPLPASALLAAFAVGLVARRLRKSV